MQLSHVLLGCAIGIAFAVIVYGVGQKIQQILLQRRASVARKGIILHILNLALSQRSSFILEVANGEFEGVGAEGICHSLTDETLIINVSDAFASHQWVGSTIVFFFAVTENGKQAFYHFKGQCIEAKRASSITTLIIAFPAYIEAGQRRHFLRYTPPIENIYGLGLWLWSHTKPLPNLKTSLGKPYLSYQPETDNALFLDNVSAGGLRFGMHEDFMPEDKSCLEKGTPLIFHVSLQSYEDEKKTLALWLSCRVTSLVNTEEEKDLWYVGVRFENWAQITQESQNFVWFPVDKDKCIAPLASWVMRSSIGQNKAQ